MALAGIRVIEFAGLAPAPFAGMALADFGAEVIRIDKAKNGKALPNSDTLSRGKKSIALDIKSSEGKKLAKKIISTADVLLDCFRPGVMERNGLGPDVLLELNPRLIYARITGFGQGGDPKVSNAAGHDLNYIALSGVLSYFRVAGEKPHPPINIMGDFAGGGLMCAFGILVALIERQKSGKGQVIDAAMVDGSLYLASQHVGVDVPGYISNRHELVGTGVLDGGAHFYQTYECKDGKYFSVGAIEGKFFCLLVDLMGFNEEQKEELISDQMNQEMWEKNKKVFANRFKKKSQKEWTDTFYGTDACAWPILSIAEAAKLEHHVKRNMFVPSATKKDRIEPAAAPKLSRTPAFESRVRPKPGQHTEEVLAQYGFTADQIKQLVSGKVVAKL
eukprot:maker-scaffold_16-snap-gene-3.12-mRNA-1 protein AED:0.33 eAED:0.33 QI:93/1/1/1/1/1/2/35/389